MALTPDDISEEYIASSRALAVTGTHLSHANTRAAVLKALEYARRHGLRTALDIDYRPVLWGLTSLGDGETRFIESGPVTSQLQEVLHLFDLVVGTEEEFHIAGGSTDTLTALKNVRNATKATSSASAGRWAAWCWKATSRTAGTRCRYSRACAWRFSTCWAPEMPLCRVCCAAGSTTKAGSRLAVTPTPAGRWWSPPRLRAGDADQSRT